mmetsp:Transcript_745/g.1303  ORF Transcript_745/g.1303 Transcript_745/m.1303 type:complete len:249 (+) Transcript_745:1231-1977(+)
MGEVGTGGRGGRCGKETGAILGTIAVGSSPGYGGKGNMCIPTMEAAGKVILEERRRPIPCRPACVPLQVCRIGGFIALLSNSSSHMLHTYRSNCLVCMGVRGELGSCCRTEEGGDTFGTRGGIDEVSRNGTAFAIESAVDCEDAVTETGDSCTWALVCNAGAAGSAVLSSLSDKEFNAGRSPESFLPMAFFMKPNSALEATVVSSCPSSLLSGSSSVKLVKAVIVRASRDYVICIGCITTLYEMSLAL